MRKLIRTPQRPSEAFARGALALGVPMLSFPIILISRIGDFSWVLLAYSFVVVVVTAALGGVITLGGAALYWWAYRRATDAPNFPNDD